MNNSLEKIWANLVNRVYLLIKNSYLKTILFIIIFFTFAPLLIESLQIFFRKLPYYLFIDLIIDIFKNNFAPIDYVFLFFIVILITTTFNNFHQLRLMKIIEDKFNNDSSFGKWIIPLGSEWLIQKCDNDASGNMLSISHSFKPGLLKGANDWYDYTLTFLAKFDKSDSDKKIGVVVRAENYNNGILLEITKTHLKPYLMYNETLIYDEEKKEQLPISLNENDWIEVKIIVKGNNIDIILNKTKVSYRISTQNYLVKEVNLYKGKTVNKNTIMQDNTEIKESIKKWIKAYDEFKTLPDTNPQKKLIIKNRKIFINKFLLTREYF